MIGVRSSHVGFRNGYQGAEEEEEILQKHFAALQQTNSTVEVIRGKRIQSNDKSFEPSTAIAAIICISITQTENDYKTITLCLLL